MITYDEIKNIEADFGTPFYLLNENLFIKNFDDITSAFESRYDKFILAYSYKTNYIPYLCDIIRKKGGYAEVVARLEYDLALKIGHDPQKIIFNGPIKYYDDIQFALSNQSIVNLDSWPEVGHVNMYASKHSDESVEIGIRINMDLSDENGVSRVHGDIKVGRFGFSTEKEQFEKLLESLSDNIKVISLHGHTTSIDRSVWCYKTITRRLCDIAAGYFPDTVKYINIGGGLYGYIPPEYRWAQTPCFDDYAEGVCEVLSKNKWFSQQRPYLVLEPGIAMAANVLSFITKVVDVKNIRGKTFVTVDGSAFNTKPTFHNHNMPHEIIKRIATDKMETYNVVGSTCMEKDCLLTEITNKKLQEGDYIEFANVGAYTIVFTPPFINVAPAILVKDGDNYKPVRKRQLPEDMFRDYLFEENV